MPFLPPECANAVVLQATLGQSGHFGSGVAATNTIHYRSPDEFMVHAQEVAKLWGRRLSQARTLFVAGADLLRWPAAELHAYLAKLTKVFPIETNPVSPSPRLRGEGRGEASPDHNQKPLADGTFPYFDGAHIFLDDFASRRPDRDDWKQFAAAGLKRASIGIASGDPAIRALYHQHWTDEELRGAFADLKSAGIGASVLTLVGAGGADHAASHVKGTAALINSLDLAPGDFVFLLDENELRGRGELQQLTLLHGDAWELEQAKLKQALAGLKDRKIKVLPYTMEKQGV
jgi:hypothetical protein